MKGTQAVGFDAITSIGSIWASDNVDWVDWSATSFGNGNIVSMVNNGDVHISANPNLTSIYPFRNLVSVGALALWNVGHLYTAIGM
jgi:hypothetical protein